MQGMSLAPFAKLLEFKPVLKLLFVLKAMVTDSFALSAFKFDEIILRHISFIYGQIIWPYTFSVNS
jgi:hypothetical protein